MAALAVVSQRTVLTRTLAEARAARAACHGRLLCEEACARGFYFGSLHLIPDDGEASLAEAKRAFAHAERALSEALVAHAGGPPRSLLIAAAHEAHPLKGVKSEAWRKRVVAVEDVLLSQRRRLEALYGNCFPSSRVEFLVTQLLREELHEYPRLAHRERRFLHAALESERRAVASKALAGVLMMMAKQPVQVCALVVAHLEPRQRAALACVHRTLRDAVAFAELTVPRFFSVAAAKELHLARVAEDLKIEKFVAAGARGTRAWHRSVRRRIDVSR